MDLNTKSEIVLTTEDIVRAIKNQLLKDGYHPIGEPIFAFRLGDSGQTTIHTATVEIESRVFKKR